MTTGVFHEQPDGGRVPAARRKGIAKNGMLAVTATGALMPKGITVNDLTQLSDDELIELAIRAYVRRAVRDDTVPAQPCLTQSEVLDGRVILANVQAVLAEYRVGKTRLVRIDDE